MTKELECLRQDENGSLHRRNGSLVTGEVRVERLITFTARSQVHNMGSVVNDLVESGELIVPLTADSFVASYFNPDTQFIRNDEALASYALQLYKIGEETR